VPTFHKLTEDEVAALTRRPPRPRRVDLSPYVGFLAQLTPGEYGRLVLEEGENRQTEKRRLIQAAELLRVGIRFHRAPKDRLMVRLLGPIDGAEPER